MNSQALCWKRARPAKVEIRSLATPIEARREVDYIERFGRLGFGEHKGASVCGPTWKELAIGKMHDLKHARMVGELPADGRSIARDHEFV
jgi:hypothetical protein